MALGDGDKFDKLMDQTQLEMKKTETLLRKNMLKEKSEKDSESPSPLKISQINSPASPEQINNPQLSLHGFDSYKLESEPYDNLPGDVNGS